jgi:hypothetical protein
MELILQRLAAAAPELVPALYTLLVAAAIDLATGLGAAAISGTLQWTYVSEFVRGHLLQKIMPIMGALVAGVAIGGIDTVAGLGLIGTGVAGATAYLFSVAASIGGNVKAAQTKTKGLPSSVTAPLTLAAPLVAEMAVMPDRFEGDRFAEPDADERGDTPLTTGPGTE